MLKILVKKWMKKSFVLLIQTAYSLSQSSSNFHIHRFCVRLNVQTDQLTSRQTKWQRVESVGVEIVFVVWIETTMRYITWLLIKTTNFFFFSYKEKMELIWLAWKTNVIFIPINYEGFLRNVILIRLTQGSLITTRHTRNSR